MRLLDLEPMFIKITGERTTEIVQDIKEADGLMCLCPTCFQSNRGPIGTHSIICWQPHINLSKHPKPGRWYFEGTGLADLTLRNGSSSIYLQEAECKAHFFIKNGNITF